MPRKQVIHVTCQYSRFNQDLSSRLPECDSQRSIPPIQQQEYVVHGIPKRLHCRPRICITPSKLGEGYFGFGRSPKMVSGVRNALKMNGSDEAKPQCFQENTKTKQQCFQENDECGAPLDTVAGEARSSYISESTKDGDSDVDTVAGETRPVDMSESTKDGGSDVDTVAGETQPVDMSETAKDGDWNVQIEICTEAAGTNYGQNSILENNSCKHLVKDTLGKQGSDTCNDQENLLELTETNVTPPNSLNSEMEPTEDLTTLAVVKHCQDNQYSRNGIHVIDESAVCGELDACDKTPTSWYHKLLELELQNKTLHVPKPKNTDRAQLASLCKCQTLTPHFPSYETSESRRISRTERHVQYMVLKENSVRPREKVRQHVRGTRKPAAAET
ncbi:hypothetical protein BsWGS_14395 [Bradybaena similaris]